MQRRVDRHSWFADYGDLISDCVQVPKPVHGFPKFKPWPDVAEYKAFQRLAYNREDNDCGVRALAVACAAPYGHAWHALAEAGRGAGHPCCIPQIMDAAKRLRCHMVATTCKARTLRTVERELAKTHGGFIVTTRDHAVGIWNGELIDHQRGTLARLDSIYRVEPMPSNSELRKVWDNLRSETS